MYNHAGFNVKVMYCDNEFQPLFDTVKDDMDVHMNYANPGEHEPHAERNNQHIKSLFRTHYHRMPYKCIPKVMTEHLARRVANTCNYYPAKGGISSHYSPHMIIHKRQVNFAHECAAEFGSYVQAWGHITKPDQQSRTLDGIYLGPADKLQPGHFVLDLNTKRVVTCKRIKVIPITSQVVNIVENMALAEDVKGLQFYDKNGEIIMDGDLLAGVDPDKIWDEDYDDTNSQSSTDSDSDHILDGDYISEEENEDNDRLNLPEDDDSVIDRILQNRQNNNLPDQNQHPDEPEDEDNTGQDMETQIHDLIQELDDMERSDDEEEIVVENTQGHNKYPDESNQNSEETAEGNEQGDDAIARRTRSSRSASKTTETTDATFAPKQT